MSVIKLWIIVQNAPPPAYSGLSIWPKTSRLKVGIPHWGQIFSVMVQNFMGGGWGYGGVWGVIVRVLHFGHFRDEKSAFFQLEVRGLP